jgi:hypothetical protein
VSFHDGISCKHRQNLGINNTEDFFEPCLSKKKNDDVIYDFEKKEGIPIYPMMTTDQYRGDSEE